MMLDEWLLRMALKHMSHKRSHYFLKEQLGNYFYRGDETGNERVAYFLAINNYETNLVNPFKCLPMQPSFLNPKFYSGILF